ncbi:MAG: DUF3108 domain-containing protein [Gallionella sp.]|nr:DUF3108 domain-containing protein [Gallionella sp.]
MIALPRTPIGRIALAITLSLMAHMVVLFAPLVKFPLSEMPLPILTARLEPLPKIAAKRAPAKRLKPKLRPAPVVPDAPQSQEVVAQSDDQPVAGSPPEAPQIIPEPPAAEIHPEPPTVSQIAEEIKPAHPLPKHARLTFTAYKGTDFPVGEARHSLEIGADKSYTLKVGMNTTGLASIFKAFELNQQSSGTLTAQGLHPNKYSETKNTSRGKEALDARFAWEEKSLSFSNGSNAQLPEQAQDIISFMYQLSQLPLDKGTLSIYISNGKKLERYELAVGEEERIQTAIGWLRALPLRKVHAQGEEGLDIWLGMEYRLLPVKIRQIDRAGQIAGEMVISEIRVADE